jgi:hypothetical protein
MMHPLELVNLNPLMDRTSGRWDTAVGLIDGPVATDHPDLSAQTDGCRTCYAGSGSRTWRGKVMKRTKTILIVVLLVGLMTIGFVNGPSSASAGAASAAPPAQTQLPDPILLLPGLDTITCYEQSTGLGIRPFTFPRGGTALGERRAGSLGAANNDFIGSAASSGGTPAEFYDVFYSNADGVPELDGRYLTIECTHDCSVCTSLNITQVNLNFMDGRVEYFNQVASVVALGSRAQPATAPLAVDGNLETAPALGNTAGQTQRLRLTLGFVQGCTYAVQPQSQSFPAFVGEVGFTSATFRVTAPAGCQWGIETDGAAPNFLSVIGLSSSGSRTVNYDVYENTTPTSRTGRILIKDLASGEIRQTFTVTQEGFGCPASGYSVSPKNVVIESGGDSFSFSAGAPPGCRPGAPSIDVDWVRLNTCVDVGERITCFFDVRPNTGNFRTGTIDVSGQKFFVYQNPQGCPIGLICAFFPGSCGVFQDPANNSAPTSIVATSRKFRDVKLARSVRGQHYVQLYYRFSTDTVQTMMFNPMLMLRSREILERYQPAVEAMARNEPVTLTSGDVDEIASFLGSFAAKSSPELRKAIESVSRDLHDPEVHREFGINVVDGPIRELPQRRQLQSILRVAGFTALSGFSFVFVLRIGRRHRKRVKRLLAITLVILVGAVGRSHSPPGRGGGDPLATNIHSPRGTQDRLNHSIAFEPNLGQTDPRVKFVSRTGGYNLYLTETDATVQFKPRRPAAGYPAVSDIGAASSDPNRGLRPVLRFKLSGANASANLAGAGPLPSRYNYFTGKSPDRWRTGITAYSRVRSSEVYPGVDMLYYGTNGELEYDFIVAPGADHKAIRLDIEGADEIVIDDRGDLVLHMAGEEMRLRKPAIYQEKNGRRETVEGGYTLHNNAAGFDVGSYDTSRPLIIDPVLSYSTYLGGIGGDEGNSIAVDQAGNIYIAGFTDSLNFPLAGSGQPLFGGGQQDAFIVKLDPSGTRAIYSTYLGGDGQDNATGIAVDSSGNAWVTGFTGSTDFPVRNAIQANRAGPFNCIVVRLDAAGSLAYSTHLGGSGGDQGSSVAMDGSGNVYVAGVATSSNFPLIGALQPAFGGASDLFMAKFNDTGRQLLYSTYLGGAGFDGASGIAVDAAGNVYLTGLTSSPNLRIANALQQTHRGGLFDAFVAKINPSGSGLVYSTYLGGNGEDRGFRIAVDAAGSAYITGDTDSPDFPTASPLQSAGGGRADAFIVKLNPSGNQLIYSTYLGGSGFEGGTAVAVDATGGATVSGFTSSMNFPTVNALQQVFGGGSFDAFVAKIGATGSVLNYATYLGGSGIDAGFGVAGDVSGTSYVMGQTDSNNFPTASSLQATYGGGSSDVFVARIRPGPLISEVAIQGKHLIVSGAGFERGAIIFVNGEAQLTKFQSAASLKGKKSARNIIPGQTVRLQVRNTGGETSSEFSFTRASQ